MPTCSFDSDSCSGSASGSEPDPTGTCPSLLGSITNVWTIAMSKVRLKILMLSFTCHDVLLQTNNTKLINPYQHNTITRSSERLYCVPENYPRARGRCCSLRQCQPAIPPGWSLCETLNLNFNSDETHNNVNSQLVWIGFNQLLLTFINSIINPSRPMDFRTRFWQCWLLWRFCGRLVVALRRLHAGWWSASGNAAG